VLFGFSLNATGIRAQSIWLEPLGHKEIHLEIIKPAFAEDGYLHSDFTALTLTYFLSGRFTVGENSRFVSELPFAHAAVKDGNESDTTIGNLYLGAEFGPVNSGVQGDFGVRIPIAANDNLASVVGAFSDYVDRFEAFLPEVLSVIAAGKYKYRSAGGFGLGLRLAPVLWIDTSDSSDDDSELLVLYSLMVWQEGDIVGVGGGISGRYFATVDDVDFGQRTFHQLGFFANFTLDRWMPGIQLRVPLDEDLKDLLATEISLSIGVKID
jgi:hypothetical protein